MARSPIAGISGVLGELIGKSPEPETERADTQSTIGEPLPRPRKAAAAHSQKQPHRRARLGRPAGRRAHSEGPKEKVTLRINAELIAKYRDWSWESRCQLGELVEQALAAYLRTSRPKP
jgi:hypothetical protein